MSKKKRTSTRAWMQIKAISAHSIHTTSDELVFYHIKPTNLSVLSPKNIAERIFALTNLMKVVQNIEILCLNSRENFEQNKAHLAKRLQQEQLPAVRKLLEQDLLELDRMQLQMATAREFLIVLRFRPKTPQLEGQLIRTEKSLKDQGFVARRAREQDLKRLLAVYYEQNVTSEIFESIDGERWVIFND